MKITPTVPTPEFLKKIEDKIGIRVASLCHPGDSYVDYRRPIKVTSPESIACAKMAFGENCDTTQLLFILESDRAAKTGEWYPSPNYGPYIAQSDFWGSTGVLRLVTPEEKLRIGKFVPESDS